MIIRHAQHFDNEELMALTSLTPMEGVIGLRIDRKPDFFSLLQKRGPSLVMVAEEDHHIIGSLSASVQEQVIGNETYPVYYLGDLKVHPQFSGSLVAFRLLKTMHEELLKRGADIVFCTIADGNTAVKALLEGRANFPAFRHTGVFQVYQILPRRQRQFPSSIYSGNVPGLDQFYLDYNHRYCLFPASPDLESCQHYVWKENNLIKAAIAVYDPSPFKQNVVVSYPSRIALMLSLLKGLKKLLPLPAIPAKGAPLKILYIRYFGCLEGEEQKLNWLLKKIRDDAFRNGYNFLSFTVHEKDSLLDKLVSACSQFSFRSHGYITSLQHHQSGINNIVGGIPYEDYSLV